MSFSYKKSNLYAENVRLATIAETVGTPVYVYSGAVIRHQFTTLRDTLADVLPQNTIPLLCYACKANSNLAVLSHLRGLGSGLEIVSEGELIRGLRAGFDPKTIVSTGVGKSDSEIAACLKAGILQINVESLSELKIVQEIAASLDIKAEIVLRFNPDVAGGGHDKISTGRKGDKFGISAEQVYEGFKIAKAMSHVDAVGLSMHIGSQVFTVQSFKAAFSKLPNLVRTLRADGHRISRLDIGGGFPIKYKDETLLDLTAYAEWVRDIIVPLDTQIIMEPGRYLVGNAGVLLTRTVFDKRNKDERFLIVDAAMNDLARVAMYDAHHEIDVVQKHDDRKDISYDIVGPVCESSDKFANARALQQTERGELVAIRSAGAYGFTMASNYNTRPLTAEVMVSGDEFAVIRERQTYDTIIDLDAVPDWLS